MFMKILNLLPKNPFFAFLLIVGGLSLAGYLLFSKPSSHTTQLNFAGEPVPAQKKPQRHYVISCRDESDNKLYENNVSSDEFNIEKGTLYIYKGDRAGNIYTCYKFSWERQDAL
jgi:hypothetical protein